MTKTKKETKTQYTPGQWHLRKHGVSLRHPDGEYAGEADRWILGTEPADSGRINYDVSIRQTANFIAEIDGGANARLIAAAPELLAALKIARNFILSGMDPEDGGVNDPIMQPIRAAIAKAESYEKKERVR